MHTRNLRCVFASFVACASLAAVHDGPSSRWAHRPASQVRAAAPLPLTRQGPIALSCTSRVVRADRSDPHAAPAVQGATFAAAVRALGHACRAACRLCHACSAAPLACGECNVARLSSWRSERAALLSLQRGGYVTLTALACATPRAAAANSGRRRGATKPIRTLAVHHSQKSRPKARCSCQAPGVFLRRGALQPRRLRTQDGP